MNIDERLLRITELMLQDDSVDAPLELRQWANNFFRSRMTEKAPSAIQRVVAWLQSDLAAGKPAFGERSAAASKTRQMLFRTDDTAIDLRINDIGKKIEIRGQLLGVGSGDVAVELMLDGNLIVSSNSVDGTFDLGRHEKERYSLIIRSAQKEVVIEDLPIA